MPSSSPPHPAQESLASSHSSEKEEEKPAADDTITASDLEKQAEGQETPSDAVENHHANVSSSPSPLPADVPPFDWDDFETRYERALREADEAEREILKEAESLSKTCKYFQVWAASASAHDDDRAAKRLRTRQRFVILSEEKMAQKQKHYEEVVRAFESALALLKSS
ncbi:uncharacterized protein UV8b_02708 [Ustilaginoidea virens]|uniref:Uncharacterized protein n=1 Tax=Ustilaginoidea virens TaxID=1159556 RepID=A0A8E5MG33_USTVR|nr:uncharacterized protein UV8b_02708 [Ustilaginoidea virens]QUC18467.1 hypothetical protein UV8b_02708 [Ustilaginoidea virens]